MKERNLFSEVPGRRNDFHSAILTSFSFNFHHFEFQVLRTLRQKWVTNVAVLVDQSMLDGSIGLASGNLKQLSQSYSVNGIRSIGAFHPKITYLVGDNKLLMFFGSGNITPGGHGKNHELFTTFYADSLESIQRPILLESWNYINSLTHDIAGYNKDRITKQVVSNSELLRERNTDKHIYYQLEDDIEVALLYNEDTSIFSQLTRLIPNNSVTKITIVCPYYDEDGATLLSIANHFGGATLDVYIPVDFGLPPVSMQKDSRINFYAWEATERGIKPMSGDSTYVRKLHSKIFHFESDGFQYLMLGSANATKPGLGSLNQRGINDEFSALYKSPHLDFLSEIGIRGKKRRIDVKGLVRSSFMQGDEGLKRNHQHRLFITGVDLNNHSLTVYLKNTAKDLDAELVIYNAFAAEVHRSDLPRDAEREISLKLSHEVIHKDLAYVEIVDLAGVSISNKQLINNLEKLFPTDPSKANRSINQVISGLETGSIDEFEILSYLNDINHAKGVSQTQGPKIGSRKDQDDKPVVEMTYDEAVEASKNPLQNQKIIRTHHSVRLWESISRLLFDRIQRRDDELEDEEEDAKAEESNVRKKNPSTDPPLPKGIKVDDLIKQVERLVKKYESSLTHVTNMKDHRIDIIDFVQFLLVTHIVTALTYHNDGTGFKEKEWQFKLRVSFKYKMMDILVCFNKLLIRQKLEESDDPSDQFSIEKRKDYQTKTIYNFLLYIHLIDSLSPEAFMRDELELLSFNLFDRLGLSDSHFERYVDDMSRTEDEVLFNVSAAIHLRDALEEKYIDLDNDDSYFQIEHSGRCMVKEKTDHQVRYQSIYGTFPISIGKYKKYKANQN